MLLFHDPGKGFRLGDRARKSVEQEPAAAADAAGALPDEIQHGLVGDEFAASHEFQGGHQRWTAFAIGEAFGGAEDVAGGKVAGAQPFAEQFRLGALAHARRTQQHQPEKPRRERRKNLALGRATLEPGDSNGLCCHKISMKNVKLLQKLLSKEPLIQVVFEYKPINTLTLPKMGEAGGGNHFDRSRLKPEPGNRGVRGRQDLMQESQTLLFSRVAGRL